MGGRSVGCRPAAHPHARAAPAAYWCLCGAVSASDRLGGIRVAGDPTTRRRGAALYGARSNRMAPSRELLRRHASPRRRSARRPRDGRRRRQRFHRFHRFHLFRLTGLDSFRLGLDSWRCGVGQFLAEV